MLVLGKVDLNHYLSKCWKQIFDFLGHVANIRIYCRTFNGGKGKICIV